METLSDIYEKEWVGQDMLYVQVVLIGILSTCAMITFQAQNNEMLWADLAHKLSDQVVIPLNTYQAQFPEMRVSSWTIDICRSQKKIVDAIFENMRIVSWEILSSVFEEIYKCGEKYI